MDAQIPCPYTKFLEVYSEFKFGDGDMPSQDLVACCLMYSFLSNEPLPREVVGLLVREFEVINRGYDSPLFAKPVVESFEGERIPRKTHPEAAYLEYRAVSYVKTCRRTGWDKKPIKTITDAFGVSRTAYYNWEKKYTKARDDYTKEGMRMLLDELAPLYQKKKFYP